MSGWPIIVRSRGIGCRGKLGVAFVRRRDAVYVLGNPRSRGREWLRGPLKIGVFSSGYPSGRKKC